MLLLVILPLPHVLSAHTPAGACLARLLLTLRSVCLPCLLLCHFFQPYCPVCVQVYKAKMGELDVAVKMIQKQHVNPQLTPQQALQVMQQVTSCCFAAVLCQLCHSRTLFWVHPRTAGVYV
jgi:hypothetical protein